MTTRTRGPLFVLLVQEANRVRRRQGLPPMVDPVARVPTVFRAEAEARWSAGYLLGAWQYITDPRDWPPPWHARIPLTERERVALAVLRLLVRSGTLRPLA